MKKHNFEGSKNLSYADSILSGFFYDSFNRKQSACTFVYYSQDPTNMVYTLQLSKDWLFTKGNSMFHFVEGSLETDGVFEQQECFHPRLREILPASRLKESSLLRSVKLHNAISSDHYEFDIESPYTNFDNYIEECTEKKKITQFLLTACDVLSQARIFSLEGESIDPQNYPKKALEILESQKELLKVFYEKVSKRQK